MYYYHSLNAALREQFGCKVYKLALHGATTCPNRDGTCGTRGCIFCTGSGEFAAPPTGSITQQLEAARARVAAKNRGRRYIAYFQAFTNTYAPVSVLRPRFLEAITHPDVVALSIATRPDCLPPEVLTLLRELAEFKPVWVELGLQTIHPQTAHYIRRGYALPVYDRAVQELHNAGVSVITHMILGLPGESDAEMVQTARYIGASGADGIKFHLLHVLAGTDLADEYAAGRVRMLTLDEYITLLERCLAVLPPQVVIHRLTGDGAKRSLIAPLWSADKKRVLNAIRRRFEADHVLQGSELPTCISHDAMLPYTQTLSREEYHAHHRTDL